MYAESRKKRSVAFICGLGPLPSHLGSERFAYYLESSTVIKRCPHDDQPVRLFLHFFSIELS